MSQLTPPSYFFSLNRRSGKNEKDLEEAQKAGDIDTTQDFTVDEFAPHPNYIFSKGLPLSEGKLSMVARLCYII